MIRLFLCSMLVATPALAQTGFQDVTQLDTAVATFTGQPIGAEGGPRTAIDKRLKLAPCQMVALSWRAANHDSVVVTCQSPAWKIYVPVLVAPTPVAPRPETVAAAAVEKLPVVIKRGDPVTVEAGAPGFSITREGIAMSEAAPGGRFLVNVDGVKKPIQAIAVDSGRATLPGYTQ